MAVPQFISHLFASSNPKGANHRRGPTSRTTATSTMATTFVACLLLGTFVVSSSSSSSLFADGKVFNVVDYGVKMETNDLTDARSNGEVIYNVAMNMANTDPSQRVLSDNDGYNTVMIPQGTCFYVPYRPFVGLYKIHFQIIGNIILPNSNQSRSEWPANDLPRPTLHDEETMYNTPLIFHEKKKMMKTGGGGGSIHASPRGGGRKHVLDHAASSEISSVSHLRLDKHRNYNAYHNQQQHGESSEYFIYGSGKNTTTALDAFYIFNSTGIRFDGGGMINGEGYPWWWDCILTGVDRRPYLIMMKQTEDIYIGNLHLRDSPMYHVYLYDTKNILVEYVRIDVNIWGQLEIQQIGKERTRQALVAASNHEQPQAQLFGDGIPILKDFPTFPLNTDGIDIAGVDVVVRHCEIENYDDALCPKPLNKKSVHGPCSRNQHWYNHTIRFGVGASVGSVPPNLNVNCIADVVFENLNFTNALKTLYIKPNPCPHGEAIDGTGIINNITYKDVVTTNPVTWPIWFSTQQQKQPGSGTDTGCSFLYPLPGTTCPTYPCVPITNVLLKNVTSVGGILSPGVIRCNEANPCRNITFDDVHVDGLGFPWGNNSYLCQAIDNFNFIGGSYPNQCIYNYTV